MMGGMPARRAKRPLTIVGVLTTLAGVLLFVWWIRRIGVGEIVAGFRQIGWGLLVVVFLGGLRFATRALAWIQCVEPPHRLKFRAAFAAVVAGDALGTVTPLGPLASEPAKVAFVRSELPLGAALTALAIENVAYTLSVAAMIAAGMLALLLYFQVPGEMREAGRIAVAAVAVLFALSLGLLWMRPAVLSRGAAILVPGSIAHPRLERLRAIEHQIYSFASRRGTAVLPLVACELSFHALGVIEAHVTLWLLLGAAPPLLISFIVETVNRLIMVLFKVVPMQVGVNEAGSALLTDVLGLGAASGTTLGLVRKVRMLCWAGIGLLLLAHRGLSAGELLSSPPMGDQQQSQ
jgi:hypothetical protein